MGESMKVFVPSAMAVAFLTVGCSGPTSQAPETLTVTETVSTTPLPQATVTVTAKPDSSASSSVTQPGESDSSSQSPSLAAALVGTTMPIGPLEVTLESVDQIPHSGGMKIVELWFDVANGDNRPVSPFCGPAFGVIIDDAGREFEGDTLIEDYTANCGDDINPGLARYPYVTRYLMPEDSQVATIRVWADEDLEPFAVDWTLGE